LNKRHGRNGNLPTSREPPGPTVNRVHSGWKTVKSLSSDSGWSAELSNQRRGARGEPSISLQQEHFTGLNAFTRLKTIEIDAGSHSCPTAVPSVPDPLVAPRGQGARDLERGRQSGAVPMKTGSDECVATRPDSLAFLNPRTGHAQRVRVTFPQIEVGLWNAPRLIHTLADR